MLSRSVITLNIEANDVRYLVARGRQILSWGSLPLAPGLVKQGLIADSVGLGSAINTLFMEKKLPKGSFIASMTGLRSALRIFSLPKVKPSLLEEAIRHEAEREMPVPLEELYLSSQLLSAKGAEQRFFVLGIPRDIIDTELQTLALAGISPKAMNLKPLALIRAVNRSEALIIDMEPETFDLVMVSGGIPVIMRTVISRGEGMVLEDRIPQLTDELARTVEFYNSSHPEHPLDPTMPVLLTGQLADDSAACDLVKAATNSSVETLTSPGRFSPDFPLGQFAVNIGLARRQFSLRSNALRGNAPFPAVNPNVLPQRYGQQPLSPTRIVFPLVATVLVTLAFFMYQWQADVRTEVADISNELASVNRQIDKMREITITTTTAANNAEEEADRLKEERESILAAMATSDLSDTLQTTLDAIPTGVQITSINQTADQINLHGDADSKSSIADYVLALERTGVFSTVYVSPLSKRDNDIPATFSIIGDNAATQ